MSLRAVGLILQMGVVLQDFVFFYIKKIENNLTNKVIRIANNKFYIFMLISG